MATNAVLDGPSRLSYRGPSPILIAKALGAVVAVVGLVVLVGWLLDAPALISLVPGWMSMKAGAALGVPAERHRVGAGIGRHGDVGEAGAPGARRGRPRARRRDAGVGAGLTAPRSVAGLNFALVGMALLALDAGNDWRVRPSESLSLAMGLLAFVGLEGYVFGKASLYLVPAFSTLALHTALCFVALAIGVFVVRPTVGLMRHITARRDRRRHAPADAADLADPAAGDRVGTAAGRARRLFRRGDRGSPSSWRRWRRA